MRALFDATTITVYQAYSPEIADAAVDAGTFVPPFRVGRMTWIKPSFRWMMYRSGWASKVGQERVLAVRIAREGFEQALSESCLSHYDPAVYGDRDAWLRRKEISPVRVQWDPERSADLDPLPWRAIQIGLSGSASARYTGRWITGIRDITATVHLIHRLLADGDRDAAQSRLPVEEPYPLSPEIARAIGATPVS